jgi:hypothetical protein
MTVNRVQAIRSSVGGNRPAAGTRAPGELYTNWADLQLGCIDSSKNPIDLVAVRFFSAAATYVAGNYVVQGGNLFRAKATIPPGVFNTSQWDKVTSVADPIVGYLPLAGGTLTGPLTLAADPAANLQPATKQYVDNAISSWAPPAPSVPAGTVMLFWQAAAPSGWTKLTTQNDKALRVVSGSGGVSGGTNPFSTVMAQANVGSHALTLSELPAGISSTGTSANTTFYFGGSVNDYAPVCPAGWGAINESAGSGYIGPVLGGGSSVGQVNNAQGTVTLTATSTNTGGQGHNHAITMAIQYIDLILCSKN